MSSDVEESEQTSQTSKRHTFDQHKHQQGLVLPLRGFSSAAANQMTRRNKNMDFIFYMRVTETRAQ